MPAGRRREGCTEAGVRKASKEESAGSFAPAVVSVYGDLTRGCETLAGFPDGDAGRVSGAKVILVGLGAVGRVVSCCGMWDLGFCARRRRWRLPSVESGRYRRDLGAGQAERQRVATRAYWS